MKEKHRVFFILWKWGKQSQHELKQTDIHDLRYEEFKDQSGILHIIAKDSPSFRTYAFTGAGRRHHPTFENIPAVVSLHKQLQELRSLQL